MLVNCGCEECFNSSLSFNNNMLTAKTVIDPGEEILITYGDSFEIDIFVCPCTEDEENVCAVTGKMFDDCGCSVCVLIDVSD